MKNKKILHIVLTLALVLSIIPLATVTASAGTGSKTLIKTKMDRGAWWVTLHRVAESDTTE